MKPKRRSTSRPTAQAIAGAMELYRPSNAQSVQPCLGQTMDKTIGGCGPLATIAPSDRPGEGGIAQPVYDDAKQVGQAWTKRQAMLATGIK